MRFFLLEKHSLWAVRITECSRSKPGTLIELKEVQFTRDAYGPVMVLSCWAKGYQEPLYLVSNMDAAEEACRYYQKRFRIQYLRQLDGVDGMVHPP